MTATNAYVLVLPRSRQRPPDSETSNQLAAAGILQSDSGTVETISTEPGTQRVNGAYVGRYAWKLAAELKQLPALGSAIPVHGTRDPDAEGYYAVERAQASAVQAAAADWLQRYDLSLTREGTRANSRRAVRTRPQTADNPFSTTTSAELGIPATATEVEWLDEETGQTASPSLVTTRSAELGDLSVYDALDAPYTDPTLVYDVAYADEGDVDPRVWDERDVGSKHDADGHLQWQKVFATNHNFAGERVLDNGLFRLRFGSSAGLSAERWDEGTGSWDTQSLGTSDWAATSLDIRDIGFARIDARVRFEDTTSSSTYALDVSLKRGWTDPLWLEPQNAGTTPTGLQDLLSPIASDQTNEALANQGLVDRAEVV